MERRSVSALERFVGAVHRRHVLLRVAERTGLGLLAGAVASVALLPVLLWRDDGVVVPSVAALMLGAACGLAWAAVRRPTRLATAIEADRQLVLNDLLGTALSVRGRTTEADEPWAASLLALADRQSEVLSPAAVSVSRLSGRAWAGVGLAVALALSLVMFVGMSTGPRLAQGRAESNSFIATGRADGQPERPLLVILPKSGRGALPGADNDPSDDRPGGPKEGRPNETDQSDEPKAGESASHDNGATDAADSAGGGAGVARSHSPPEHLPPDSPAASNLETRVSQPPTPDGRPAGGAGLAAGFTGPATSAQEPAGTTASARGDGPRDTPPWQSDRWPADVQRARQALDANGVPPGYRDVIQTYFDRH